MFYGMMFDLGRALENRDYYRRAIEFLAQRGVTTLLWHFTDDQGCGMQFDSVPGIASPNAYSKAEMRELVLYARGLGVELVPELASLGHTVYLTRMPQYRHLAETDEMFTSMCPVAPETLPLLKKLIEETAEVFDGPNFHVGLDETNFGRNPLTQAALQTRSKAEIFADHVRAIHTIVTGLGRRMWMWADGLLHDRTLAAHLPRDIVMCNWKYRPIEPTDSTQYLLDSGFDVVLCSASISSRQTLFPGEQFSWPNIRSLQPHEALVAAPPSTGKILGHINTIWTPVRFMADSLWLGFDLALKLMRNPAADLPAEIAAFADSFYGICDPKEFTRAALAVMKLSPTRDEWLAVLAMTATAEQLPFIAAAAPGWADARDRLQCARATVQAHQREYDTFALMVELAAHLYATQAGLEALSPDDLQTAIAESERLLAKVDATWDAERYADDPRKYAAPIHFFDGDHLIPMIRSGIQRLGELASNAVTA